MQHLIIRRGKAKQGTLLGGDDESLTRCRQILGICLIFGSRAGSFGAQRASRRLLPPGRVLRESDIAWKDVAFRSSETTCCGASCRGDGGTEFAYSILLPEFCSTEHAVMRSGWVRGNQGRSKFIRVSHC